MFAQGQNTSVLKAETEEMAQPNTWDKPLVLQTGTSLCMCVQQRQQVLDFTHRISPSSLQTSLFALLLTYHKGAKNDIAAEHLTQTKASKAPGQQSSNTNCASGY